MTISCFNSVKAKLYGVTTINPALSLLMKHLVIGQRQKAPNFSAFHWSSHGSLISIGQHFVTTRVVHLPKRTETSSITESDLICCCTVVLRPRYTSKVMLGRSVNLITPFLGRRRPPKRLTSTSCTYFRQ